MRQNIVFKKVFVNRRISFWIVIILMRKCPRNWISMWWNFTRAKSLMRHWFYKHWLEIKIVSTRVVVRSCVWSKHKYYFFFDLKPGFCLLLLFFLISVNGYIINTDSQQKCFCKGGNCKQEFTNVNFAEEGHEKKKHLNSADTWLCLQWSKIATIQKMSG